jgi:hypothetical protein
MGGSISAGHILIADGSDSAERRLARCLHVDPGIAVIRHADASYEDAEAVRLRDPMSCPAASPDAPASRSGAPMCASAGIFRAACVQRRLSWCSARFNVG